MSDLSVEFSMIREIASASAEGVVIYNLKEGKIVYANGIAEELLSADELTPELNLNGLLKTVLRQDKDFHSRHPARAGEHATFPDVEFHFRRDNTDVYLSCSRFQVLDGANAVIFIRDISLAKQHENYLVEFGIRKNTVLDTLVHHLSGALSLMQNLSREAQKHVSETDKAVTTYLGLLQENSNQCLVIINDLVKNEYKQSPDVFVKKSAVNLVNKIWIVFDEFQKSYPERVFEFNASSDSIEINTDEFKLLQVMNNLVSNAIKFSASHLTIAISITELKAEVIVSVADQGIGIPDALKPLIFERQISSGRTGLNGERSTGLGLSISKTLIHLLKGRIWFESNEENGSVFSFSLPKNS